MLVFLEAVSHNEARISYERTVQLVLTLLEHSLGLRADQLYITYFSGHIDLPDDLANERAIPTYWRRAGVPEGNLIAIPGIANLTNVVRTEEPAGPRCEVFLRDDYGTFVEVATVVFESLIVTNTYPLAFKPSTAAVCGAAFGLERCEMVRRNARDIFQLPELERAVSQVESGLHTFLAELGANHVRRIVDGVRAAMVIMCNTRQPLSRARKARVRELRKGIIRAARSLGYEGVPILVERVSDALQETGHFNANRLAGAIRTLLWDE